MGWRAERPACSLMNGVCCWCSFCDQARRNLDETTRAGAPPTVRVPPMSPTTRPSPSMTATKGAFLVRSDQWPYATR
eukprot:scaffold20707_cov33-Tisochrysis_lutea.AAC.2